MRLVKSIVRTLLIVAGISIATGCAVTPLVSPGSIVQVNRALEIPARKARVYLQNGAEVSKSDVDPWSIYCSVLMQKVHRRGEPKLGVSAGQFEIIEIRKHSERLYSATNFVAVREFIFVPEVYLFKYEMLLRSSAQPGVRALICEKQVESFSGYYSALAESPTLAEIAIALGSVVEIKAP